MASERWQGVARFICIGRTCMIVFMKIDGFILRLVGSVAHNEQEEEEEAAAALALAKEGEWRRRSIMCSCSSRASGCRCCCPANALGGAVCPHGGYVDLL